MLWCVFNMIRRRRNKRPSGWECFTISFRGALCDIINEHDFISTKIKLLVFLFPCSVLPQWSLLKKKNKQHECKKNEKKKKTGNEAGNWTQANKQILWSSIGGRRMRSGQKLGPGGGLRRSLAGKKNKKDSPIGNLCAPASEKWLRQSFSKWNAWDFFHALLLWLMTPFASFAQVANIMDEWRTPRLSLFLSLSFPLFLLLNLVPNVTLRKRRKKEFVLNALLQS